MVNNSVEGGVFLSVTEFRNSASLFAAAVVTPSSSHLSKGRLGDFRSLEIALLDCSEGGKSDKAKRVAS